MVDQVLTFNNPATGDVFGEVRMSGQDEAARAVSEMRSSFPAWSVKTVHERVKILCKFKRLMVDSVDEITEVINRDTGKSRQDALAEVFMTVMILDEYLKHADNWLSRKRVPSGLFVFKSCYVDRKPYGVVLVIAPWNYPFYLAMPPVLAALLAGNTVVLKPSEVTAATGALMESLFERIPEINPYIKVVHGDGAAGAALVQAAPDYIFLTGSPKTGKLVSKAAAENLIPVASELGGKDAVIILEDADIDKAAFWTAGGAFYNTGQTCIAASRVYVVESIYDQFVSRLVEATRSLKMGYTAEKESQFYLGPMTDPRQTEILDRHLEDALSRGATLLTGGGRKGMFIEPMIVTGADHSMLLIKEETFGPVLPVIKVKDEAEAVRLANDNRLGLSGSVWSSDLERAKRVAGQIEAGTVVINDSLAQIAIPMLPFGGVKQSGYGRIHGQEGLMQFTRTFGVVVGKPPNPIDLAVVMRKPGHYHFGKSVMNLVYGSTLRKRMRGLAGLIKRS